MTGPQPTLPTILPVAVLLLLMGCASSAQIPQGQRNVVRLHDFLLEMNWCEVTPDRKAECELVVTSLVRDMKAGLAYPYLQDAEGNEFRLQIKDGSTGGRLMTVGAPYTLRFVASNLPVGTTRVRGVHGGFVTWTPEGALVSNDKAIFTEIPPRPAVAPVPAAAGSAVPLDSAEAATGSVAGTYWRGVIVPVVAVPPHPMVDQWKRGAYLHLREDGLIGFNWSKAGSYLYLDANSWRQEGDRFTLSMGGSDYTFEYVPEQPTLVTFLDQGGAFKMSLDRKAANEN